MNAQAGAWTDSNSAIKTRANGKAKTKATMQRGDPDRRPNALAAEASCYGHFHAAREIAIVGRWWGFNLAEITIPVGLWHGLLDKVPVGTADCLAGVVSEAQLMVHNDGGYLSLLVNYTEEILTILKTNIPG